MKRLAVSFLSASLFLTGCTKTSENTDDKLNVTASFYPVYLLTKEIVKDVEDVELKNLTPQSSGCLHDYSLNTNDMKIIENTDILVINGAGMEDSIQKAIDSVENVIDTSEGIDLIENEECDGHDHSHDEHGHDHHDHSVNSHIWLDVENAIKQSENIATNLSKYDEKNKEQYMKNFEEYKSELTKLDNDYNETLKNLQNKNIVSFHNSFDYLAKAYGLNIVETIQNEEDQELSAKEVEDLIKLMKEKNVDTIITEPQFSNKIIDTLAKETNAKVYTLDSLVTNDNGESYLEIMNHNLDVLKGALK